MNAASDTIRLTNFHSHTVRCMHASGREEDYVLQAIRAGFDTLGFADHTPWPYRSDFVSGMRMHISELENYLSTLRRLKQKYEGRIAILTGLECEAFPEYYPWLAQLKESKKVDYLLLGNHYDTNDETGGMYFGRSFRPEHVRRYLETTLNGMRSGLFEYLAHPDLFLSRYPAFDESCEYACIEICREAKALDMPLEYNFIGMRRNPAARAAGCVGYTSDEFWAIAAQTGNRAIIGVDAHAPEHLDCAQTYRSVYKKLESMGIEVISSLPG